MSFSVHFIVERLKSGELWSRENVLLMFIFNSSSNELLSVSICKALLFLEVQCLSWRKYMFPSSLLIL
uniref:Cell division protein ftsI, putative n=1 Tax=Cryptosporidium parvum TaxID=5807 RepID=F0X625_CRYPV